MAIRFFDMFAGIGGFECVGHCEIDKYSNQAYNAIYNPKGELYFEDARTINPYDLPDIDLICAGFPCQSFSVAGKRLGFADDTRGTLFFEVTRIAETKRPAYLLLENVPGLLSHDGGRTFETILSALVELGYVKPKMGVNRYGSESVTYEGVGEQKKWLRLESYGPKFVENIVQATARDILVEAMRRLEAAGYQIVMHVHDEAVIEAPADASLDDICAIMGQTPAWAEGLLLRADGYVCDFYQKD